jgi:hypothetical protein
MCNMTNTHTHIYIHMYTHTDTDVPIYRFIDNQYRVCGYTVAYIDIIFGDRGLLTQIRQGGTV